MSDSPAPLWRALVASEPSRPFVTSYDDLGDRVELSRATLDNWVSKTSNMLVDGFGTQPGDRIAVALPVHWQSLAWALSAWSVGAAVVLDGDGVAPGTEVAVTDEGRLDAALDGGAEEVVGTSLDSLGMPMREVPPMVTDYTVEVRGHGDHFPAYRVSAEEPALESNGRTFTGAELVTAGRERARVWELGEDDRLAVVVPSDAPLSALGEDLSALLAAVVSGAPLVVTPAPAEGERERFLKRLSAERVTVLFGEGLDEDLPFRRVS
ncbi:TIGR03089 family protein [Nocardiopsis alba]|uniref:AMP-binding enzyme family protein n=1 Tax=Nocardiopsis alba (strain ATCC BAA-2165 / BE74) TaxID=1205910 RepID=J7LF66_NOCAA|nr:TIGR03089 family protein [Nocardiopsis alba]AFR09509.1 AMP-binding enzyme family protein [Nocardiopsis alba ATCC BAA-2165]